jgi:hypothetical protein
METRIAAAEGRQPKPASRDKRRQRVAAAADETNRRKAGAGGSVDGTTKATAPPFPPCGGLSTAENADHFTG